MESNPKTPDVRAARTQGRRRASEVGNSQASRFELLELGLPFGNVNHRIERHV
jgi:hypothetical protein